MSNKPKESVIENFKNDKIYAQFFTKEFNPLQFTNHSINEQKLAENNAKLQEGIQILNQELHSQVKEHYQDLLQQATVIRDLEDMLIIVRNGIENLESSVSVVRAELKEPYQYIKQKTQELEKIQYAAELLRKLLRFSFVCNKLRKHLGSATTTTSVAMKEGVERPEGKMIILSNLHNARELPKAASCLFELEQIQKNFDLSGIDIVEQELEWILKVGQEIQQKAEQMLVSGLETQNQSEVANSLQIFYNLKRLNQTISQTLSVIQDKALSSIHEVLESSVIENGTAPQIMAWKAALWIRIEKLVDVLYQFCIQVWHLQKVLQKMRDPSSHSSLFDILLSERGSSITRSFWKHLSECISREFIQFSQRSQLIENTMISDYPKLIRIFNDFLKRLQTNIDVKGTKDFHFMEETTILLGGLSHFENLYMNKLSTRLLEALQRMFPSAKATPSSEEVNSFVKLITTEIELSSCSLPLYSSVAKYISKILSIFCQKSSSIISTEADAYQISDKSSSSQLKNCSIFNSITILHSALTNMIKQMPAVVAQELTQPLDALSKLCYSILTPLFAKAAELFERTLLTMHNADYASNDQLSMQSEATSKHILILQKQIIVFKNVTIVNYTFCALLAEKIKWITERILTFFVRHASLLRPLSDYGKLKLAGDTAQLELSLAPLRQVKTLGAPYQALRSFRPLIFRETNQILGASELEFVPLIDVCHHVISRAPQEIKSPHEKLGLTLAKYSQWLDEHSELEAWTNIQRSLEMYAKHVNDRGESHYDAVYPVLIELGAQITSKSDIM